MIKFKRLYTVYAKKSDGLKKTNVRIYESLYGMDFERDGDERFVKFEDTMEQHLKRFNKRRMTRSYLWDVLKFVFRANDYNWHGDKSHEARLKKFIKEECKSRLVIEWRF